MMKLFVFHRSERDDRDCIEAGVDGVVVDLERRGKAARQAGFDTQINEHSLTDIEAIKLQLGAYVICRSNPITNDASAEIDQIISAGADEILIPMITSAEQAQTAFELVGERCRLGLMIETRQAVALADELGAFPSTRIFVGLNDLRVSFQNQTIFDSISDGTVEMVRQKIEKPEFGFGGLTLPERGTPLAACHFYNELTRLSSDFTFLRRSFFSDTEDMPASLAVPAIRRAIDRSTNRSAGQMAIDRRELISAIERLRLETPPGRNSRQDQRIA